MLIVLPWLIPLTLLNLFAPSLISSLECNSTLTATDSPQTINSFAYPKFHLPKSYICQYKITAYNTSDIIVFKVIDLVFYESDKIELFGENLHSSHFQLSEGKIGEEYIVTDKNAVVKFWFDLMNPKDRKFSILYYAAPPTTKADKFVAMETWHYITSPNYPGAYPPNLAMIYSIVTYNQLASLNFKVEECKLDKNIDYIKVYSGNTINPSNVVLQMKCPTNLPHVFNVTVRQALVEFYSDYRPIGNTAPRFKLGYSIIIPSLAFSDDCTASFTATEVQQTILSPEYPTVFTPNTNKCKVSITANNPNYIIIFKVIFLSLQDNDALWLHGAKKSYTFHFSLDREIYSSEYIIPDKIAFVKFDFNTNIKMGRRFSILYYAASPITKAEKFIAENFWSILTSPNFPSTYPPNMVKLYSIATNSPTANLTFEMMNCVIDDNHDRIKVYSGRIIHPFNLVVYGKCPSSLPHEFNVPLKEALVVFYSGPRVLGFPMGFNLRFTNFDKKKIENDCGSTLTTKDIPQILSSTGYSSNDADSKDSCTYKIIAHDPNYIITFKLIDFVFEPEVLLRFHADEMIYFVFSNTSQTHGEFIIPYKETVVEVFGFGKANFSMSYSAKEPISLAHEKYVAFTNRWGPISSPKYPRNYPKNMVRIYSVKTSVPKAILLFKVVTCDIDNDYDFIKVYSGRLINHANLVQIVNCSSDIPQSFAVMSNEAIIVFNSDFDSTKSGFRLGYTMVVNGNECNSTVTTTSMAQILSSPEYPKNDTLSNSIDCLYTIVAHDDDYIIVFNFVDFAFAPNDRLQILANGVHYYSFTQTSQTSGKFIIPYKEAQIKIVANGKSKFSLSFYAASTLDHSEKYEVTDSMEYFTSPDYPRQYGHINMVRLYRVIFNYTNAILLFKMEACGLDNDFIFLRVYRGHIINSSNFVQIVNCTNEMPFTFNVTSNEALIVFNSDLHFSMVGFKLWYSIRQRRRLFGWRKKDQLKDYSLISIG